MRRPQADRRIPLRESSALHIGQGEDGQHATELGVPGGLAGHHLIHRDAGAGLGALRAPGGHAGQEAGGAGLVDVVGTLVAEAGDDHDVLLRAALRALHETQAHYEVFVAGTARLASAFDGAERLEEVLALLEQQARVVSAMQAVLERGNRVAIGAETGVDSLSECSLVIAPFAAHGCTGGTIGDPGSHTYGLPPSPLSGSRCECEAHFNAQRRLNGRPLRDLGSGARCHG